MQTIQSNYLANKKRIDAFWGPDIDGASAFNEQATRQTFQGASQVKIETLRIIPPEARAAIVILPGKSESFIKYKEVAWEFHQRGYAVFLMDHHSQGLSGRLLTSSDKVHTQHYHHYIDDLKIFIDSIVTPHFDGPLLLFAHSMGAAIAGLYLSEHTDVFKAAVLNAPMIQFKTDGFPAWFSELTVNLAVMCGLGENYILGHKRCNLEEWATIMRSASHCQARFNDNLKQVEKYPDWLLNEGPTFRWVQQWFKGCRQLRAKASSIATPLLVFQAENDTFVVNSAQDAFCRQIPNSQLVKIPESRHEIYFEEDTIRQPFLAKTLAFFDSSLS